MLANAKLSLITKVIVNKDSVNTFGVVSSNEIISISSDKSIIVFDQLFHIFQKIEKAHERIIFDISLKDKNNFATCSGDKSIKTWQKSENGKYKLNLSINNIHEDDIYKIIYLKDNTIISGSKDNKIKILNLNNNEYHCNIIIDNQNDKVFSLLHLEEKNLLISSGLNFMNFYNLKNLSNPLITKIEAYCDGKNALQKIDDKRIVVGGRYYIQIISIEEKKIIKEIKNHFLVWAICVIKEKKIFLCGGTSPDITLINSDNYEKINFINCHKVYIRGISLLKSGKIITGSTDNSSKIWELTL